MVFPSPGRRGSKPPRTTQNLPIEEDRTRLNRELEEIRRQEMVLRKKHEEIQRRAAELPKKLEERKRKLEEMIKLRAVSTVTMTDGFGRPRAKRSNTVKGRMTLPEQRSARIQFLLLCAVLLVILGLLWKSLP